jgi:hypothetical protein
MNQSTTEIASGAVRDIEPELRELFTKIVERDPREAVKMLELLNPAAALKNASIHPGARQFWPQSARTKKDGLGVRAALSIAHYETKTCPFARPYVVRLVSGFQCR